MNSFLFEMFFFKFLFRFKKSGVDIMCVNMCLIITVENDILRDLNKRMNKFGKFSFDNKSNKIFAFFN